ncbi:MAG: transketolase [Acetatifactor sp.]|nr:transketolase [Acetatifactor sp.]
MNQQDKEILAKLRKRIFITGYSGGMAHLASCFSAIDIIYTLYMKDVMKHDPKNPDMPDRDRFVLSKGHGGLALYSTLCEAGYLTEEELHTYLKPWCHIGGEPNRRDLRGIEASTGSLGHGMSVAVGMAIAQKLDKNGAKTYVMIGDGESQEGTIWEASMSAVAFSLDNLVAILDCNKVQKTNHVEETLGYVHWDEKWKSFGWNVMEVDGHDVDALKETFMNIPQNGKPTVVIAHTIKGKGVSIMEDNPIWHFKLPNRKEKKVFMEELQISEKEMEV